MPLPPRPTIVLHKYKVTYHFPEADSGTPVAVVDFFFNARSAANATSMATAQVALLTAARAGGFFDAPVDLGVVA